MIEDHEPFAELMVHMLEGLDIEVVTTLADAKTRLAMCRYSLILVDLGLPDSHGLDTLCELQRYKTPKIVLTARCDLSSEAAALGACDFIYKGDVGSKVDVYERIMFNVAKAQRSRKLLPHNVFEQIKACVTESRVWSKAPELTPA